MYRSSSPHPNPLPKGEGTINLQPSLAPQDSACQDRVKSRTRQFARRQETWFRALSECTPVEMHTDFSPSQIAELILSKP